MAQRWIGVECAAFVLLEFGSTANHGTEVDMLGQLIRWASRGKAVSQVAINE